MIYMPGFRLAHAIKINQITCNRRVIKVFLNHFSSSLPHFTCLLRIGDQLAQIPGKCSRVSSHQHLPEIQGRGGLWWAGAWTAYGFHEDGLLSGLRVIQGIDASCLPGWARL